MDFLIKAQCPASHSGTISLFNKKRVILEKFNCNLLIKTETEWMDGWTKVILGRLLSLPMPVL